MSIIINADDFGKSEKVNQAILECFCKRYVDRTTLMVNMPYAEEAVQLAKENHFFDKVGLHLNLTDGKPLTEAIGRNPLFCDEKGQFHAQFHRQLKYRLYMSDSDIRQIQEELIAQIQRYLGYGATLRHVDSHHHVHTDIPVLKALEPLLKKYEIKSIRIGRNLFHKESLGNRFYKRYYNSRLGALHVDVTDYFGSYVDYVKYFEALGTKKTAFCKNHSIEIMVHPMYNEQEILVDTVTPMNEKYMEIMNDCREKQI